MGKRGIKTPLGKRKRIFIMLNPKTIEALDVIKEKFGTTRTELIELGLNAVFREAISIMESNK